MHSSLALMKCVLQIFKFIFFGKTIHINNLHMDRIFVGQLKHEMYIELFVLRRCVFIISIYNPLNLHIEKREMSYKVILKSKVTEQCL